MELVKSKGGNITLNILLILVLSFIAVVVALSLVKIKDANGAVSKFTFGMKKTTV